MSECKRCAELEARCAEAEARAEDWISTASKRAADLGRAQAERDKLQAAYDLVQSGHGWCRCHDALESAVAERDAAQRTLETMRKLVKRGEWAAALRELEGGSK